MILLLLGLAALLVLLLGARAFSQAEVSTLRSLLAWVAALGGISLAGMLLLTGRGGAAIGALILFGPLAWSWWQEERRATRRPPPVQAPMTREEAYAVLGLPQGASEAEIRAAWVRLMQAAHPDRGGSDWLAARVNQARDVLLGRGKATPGKRAR